jgi:ubiquinone/menaquinone biosynthesis C-methylase UbiE
MQQNISGTETASNVNQVPLINPFNGHPVQKKEDALIDNEGNSFPIVNGVPRFVPNDNYTASFGFQWNKFQKTQIDRENGQLQFSKDRLLAVTGWHRENLEGKNILEVGSGAGRFSKIILEETNANLYSVDYSDAVTANFKNNGHHGRRLHLFQASVYEMPFPDNSFDKVFCFGVLQHTPDFRQSVKCLIDKAKPGGEVIVDFYPVTGWWTKLHAKYIFRPYTKKLSHEKLLGTIDRNADRLIGLYKFFDKIGLGKLVNRFLPICDINGTFPPHLDKKDLREWVVLDTFDMFSPAHDHPQRIDTVKKWFREFGMEVTFAGFMTYSGNLKVAIVKGFKK